MVAGSAATCPRAWMGGNQLNIILEAIQTPEPFINRFWSKAIVGPYQHSYSEH